MPTPAAVDKMFSPTRSLVENCVRSRAILDSLVAGCGASCKCPGCGESGFDATACRRCGYLHAVHCFSPNPAGGMMSPKPLHRGGGGGGGGGSTRHHFVPRLSPTPIARKEARHPSVVGTIQGSPTTRGVSKSPLRVSTSPVRDMLQPNNSPRVQPASITGSPRSLHSPHSPRGLVVNFEEVSPVASLRSQSPRRLQSPLLQHCGDDVITCGSPVGSYTGVSVHYSPLRSRSIQSPDPSASPLRSPRVERRDCSPLRQRVTISEKIVESDLRSLRKIRHVQQTAMECIWKGIRKDVLKRYFACWTAWARVLQPDFWEEPGKGAQQPGGMVVRMSLSPGRRASAGTQTQAASPGTPQTPSSCFSQPQGTMKRSPRVRLRQQLFEESLDFLIAVTGVVCARVIIVKMQAVSYNGMWYKKGTPPPTYLSAGGELVGDLRLSIPPAAPLPAPSLDSQGGLNAEQLEQLNETCTTGNKVFQPKPISPGPKSESEHKDSVDLTAVAYSLGGSRYGILEPVSAGGRPGGADAPHRDIEDYRLPAAEGTMSADASISSAADAPSPGGGTPSRQIASRPQKAQKVLSPKPTPMDHYLENRPDTPEKEITSSTQDKSSSYLTPQLNPESKHMPSRGTRRQKPLATKDTPDSAPMPQLSTSSDPQDPDSRHTSDPTIAASMARSDLSIAGAVATSKAVKSLVASIGREVASLGVSQSQISQISHLNLNESTDSADVLARSAPSPRNRTTPGVDDITPVPHALTPKAKPCTHLPAKPRRPGSKKLGNQAYPPEEVLDRSGASLSQFNSDDMSGHTDDDGLPPFTPPQSALSAALFPRRVPPSSVITEPGLGSFQELSVADSIDLDPNEGKLPPPVRRPLCVMSPEERWKSHGNSVGVGGGGGHPPRPSPRVMADYQLPHSGGHHSTPSARWTHSEWNHRHTSTPAHYPRSHDDLPPSLRHTSTDTRTNGDHVRRMELGHVSPQRRRRNVTVTGPPKKNPSAIATGIRVVSQQSSRESPRRMPVSDVADHVVGHSEVMEERGKQDALLLEIDRLRSENLALRLANSEPVATPPLPVAVETPIMRPLGPPPPSPPPPPPPPVAVVHMPIADVDPTTSPHREPPSIVLPVFNPRDFRSERSHERYR